MALKTYLMTVKSKRSKFSVSFEACDDKGAIEHAIKWAKKARLAKDAVVQIGRPDGSTLDASGAISLYLDDLL